MLNGEAFSGCGELDSGLAWVIGGSIGDRLQYRRLKQGRRAHGHSLTIFRLLSTKHDL